MCHLPAIMSSGVSWVISCVAVLVSAAAFLPCGVIWSVRVVLGSMVKSVRFFSCSAASFSSGLRSSSAAWCWCLSLRYLRRVSSQPSSMNAR